MNKFIFKINKYINKSQKYNQEGINQLFPGGVHWHI